jgi:hypothetical protein
MRITCLVASDPYLCSWECLQGCDTDAYTHAILWRTKRCPALRRVSVGGGMKK